MKEKRNIIVVCLDTFRADIIGDNEKLSWISTPNLDKFLKKSIKFSNAFGESQPTLQMRRSVFTGMRSFPWRWNFDRKGHWHHAPGWHKIPPEHPTLSEILFNYGYMTSLIADTYHMFKPTLNFTRGFVNYEFIRGQESDNWKGGNVEEIKEILKKYNETYHPVLIQYLMNVKDRKKEEDYFPAQVFQKASKWLEENLTNMPFFLWIDSFDPHEPWDPPIKYFKRYYPNYKGIKYIYPYFSPKKDFTPQEKKMIKALYAGEVSFVDRWIGELFNTMERLKLWKNTIVVVVSDHGTELFDHGCVGKSPLRLYSYNTRINCIIYIPDGPSNISISGFIQAHDITSTILDLVGINYSPEGKTFLPMIKNPKKKIRQNIVIAWAGWTEGRATARLSIRDERWNYIVGAGYQDEEPELYDIHTDPEERKNVIKNYPQVVKKLRNLAEQLIGGSLETPFNEYSGKVKGPYLYWEKYT